MRRLWKVLRRLSLAVLVLLVAGAVYGRIGLALDARVRPPASEMVDVGGRTVHLICTGEGARTFVLDAGLGGFSTFWWAIQPELSKHGRVCSFDRAGTGWSDSSDAPHDGLAAADELHALVAAAGIATPFVYVGHSLGANFGRIYYGRYPEQVAALVLLDPGHPVDMLEDFKGTRDEAMQAPECRALCLAASVAGHLGIPRLAAHLAPGKSFSDLTRPQYRAGISRPAHARAVAAYLGALPRTAYEDMDVKSFGDTPVLTLCSSELRQPEGKETSADVLVWRQGYLRYLASLAAQSTRGSGPIEIPGSTHKTMVLGDDATHHGQPLTVVREIAAFFERQAASGG